MIATYGYGCLDPSYHINYYIRGHKYDHIYGFKFLKHRQELCTFLGGYILKPVWPAMFDTKEDCVYFIKKCMELGYVG